MKIVDSTLHIYSLICCCLKYSFHWTFTFSPTNPTAPFLHKRFQIPGALCVCPVHQWCSCSLSHQVSSLSESEDSQDSSDSIGSSQKARGILARRPSYRYGCATLGVFIWDQNNSPFPWFSVFCCPPGCFLSLETLSESAHALNFLSHHCCEETLTPLTGDLPQQDFVKGRMFTSCNFTQLYHFTEVRSAVKCQTPFFTEKFWKIFLLKTHGIEKEMRKVLGSPLLPPCLFPRPFTRQALDSTVGYPKYPHNFSSTCLKIQISLGISVRWRTKVGYYLVVNKVST